MESLCLLFFFGLFRFLLYLAFAGRNLFVRLWILKDSGFADPIYCLIGSNFSDLLSNLMVSFSFFLDL